MTTNRLLNLSAATIGMGLTLMTLGNVPPYIFLVVGMVMGVMGARREKMIPATWQVLVKNPFTWGLMAFVGLMLFASIHGINPDYSTLRVNLLALLLGCGLLLFHAFRSMTTEQHKVLVQWIVNGVLASYILIVLLFIFEPWFLKIGVYHPDDAWTIMRLRFFSSVLAVLLPLCWMQWLQDGKGGYALSKSAMGLIAISMLATLICAGRAGWMGLAVGGVLFGYLMLRYHGLKFNWRLLLSGLVGFAGVGLVAFLWLYGFASFGERVGLIIPARGLGGGRLDIWAMAIQGIQEHPLTGIGMNAFRFIPGADYHPHNFVLQLALEGGIPALALAAVMILGALYVWWKGVKVSPLMAAMFSSLVAFFVCALTNRSIFNPEWMIYLMFIAAFGAGIMSRGFGTLTVKPDRVVAKTSVPAAKSKVVGKPKRKR